MQANTIALYPLSSPHKLLAPDPNQPIYHLSTFIYSSLLLPTFLARQYTWCLVIGLA